MKRIICALHNKFKLKQIIIIKKKMMRQGSDFVLKKENTSQSIWNLKVPLAGVLSIKMVSGRGHHLLNHLSIVPLAWLSIFQDSLCL